MNILYLAHRIPYPPDKGDKLRAFRQIEHLSKRHRVWCACFVDDARDTRYTSALRKYCAEVAAIRLHRIPSLLRGLVGLAKGTTLTETYYQSAAMKKVLKRWTRRVSFDAVVAFSSGMAPYALHVPARRRVLDLCDLDSLKWLDYASISRGPASWLYRMEGGRLARRERSWIDAFDASILITQAEADHLVGIHSRERLYVVGNGASLVERPATKEPSARTEGGSATVVPEGDSTTASPLIVGFVGVMNYRPNVEAVCWFVHECWEKIREACPAAVFRVVGSSPTGRVKRLAAVPGVEVVGRVEDVTTELMRFDVSVAPLRIARGLQNKVLEAMAAAKPVVLTSGAATGIDALHGREFLIANLPDAMTADVIKLLRDPPKRRRMGQAARAYVAAHHPWNRSLEKLEMIVTGSGDPHSQPLLVLSENSVPVACE